MDNWDPAPSERIYYRSAQTGDLGYIVRRGGVDKIRLDRPMEEIVMPFNESSWTPEREFKPFTWHQVAHLAFESDKLLCRMLGLHKESRREWMNLSDKERIEFEQEGPAPSGLRAELYRAVTGALKGHSR